GSSMPARREGRGVEPRVYQERRGQSRDRARKTGAAAAPSPEYPSYSLRARGPRPTAVAPVRSLSLEHVGCQRRSRPVNRQISPTYQLFGAGGSYRSSGDGPRFCIWKDRTLACRIVLMQTTAIGFLGTTLDRGGHGQRWERWRPTVDLFRHEDLLVHRLELLIEPRFGALASEVAGDIASVSPETTVRVHPLTQPDPWDFEQVYEALLDWARAYPWRLDEEQYLVHITTGTHVEQICLFLLAEARELPGRLVQTSPPRRGGAKPGTYTVIDLDLSRYDRLASRFAGRQREGLSFLKSGIDTRNAAFNRLIERIEHVAIASRAPLLLTGPTGAGKSRLARRIHELKKARHQVAGPFVEVNCATL